MTGALLASGRDGDIFEYGPGLVLRKTRDGRSIAHEARVMTFLAGHGYPVPRVDDVRADGSEIVMERLDGPIMMDAMVKSPRVLIRAGAMLADLHDQLHEIRAPEWMRVLEPSGDRVLHLDLHPLNVMLTARGPVVIDWSNASRGEPLTDVAMTYVLMTGPRMPAPWIIRTLVQPLRGALARSVTRRYPGPDLDARIAYAAELKVLDRNMLPDEIMRLTRIGNRYGKRAPG